MGSEVHAAITLVMGRVAEKNTCARPWGEFMRHGGCGIGIAQGTENAKGRVIWVGVMKSEVRGRSTNGFGGKAIKDVSGVVESFYPKARGQTSLK